MWERFEQSWPALDEQIVVYPDAEVRAKLSRLRSINVNNLLIVLNRSTSQPVIDSPDAYAQDEARMHWEESNATLEELAGEARVLPEPRLPWRRKTSG